MINPEKLQPLEDRVVILPIAPPEKTKGGIIIANLDPPRYQTARVYAVGPGRHSEEGVLVPLRCKVGDTVLIENIPGYKMGKLEDGYFILREAAILAIAND